MASVFLRPARLEDLPFVADLAAEAMVEDELFAYLCPHRHEHYADFRLAFLRRLKTRLVTPGFAVMVAVEPCERQQGGLYGEKQIRGYAVWERMGKSDKAARWKHQNNGWWHGDPSCPHFTSICPALTALDPLERSLLALESRYLSLVSPDRSVDPHRLEHYHHACLTDCFPFDNFPELWYLGNLAVAPAYQRRGIGRLLLEWGLDHARREHVAVGLEASAKGVGLYERAGFRPVNAMELMPGIPITAMLWQDLQGDQS
ncbi:GNAT family acetyltransferase [Penicillium macrosclerotiorum]|uniref:GNAT family acetyltransferase n=1 Tax=Penicillium macrosclerotiorum TaxID=303699 RepID=UPI0025484228|nr:GNAT family acetyltransferase [Penicillium macrosclerotiorum]KAJ5691815.1 GNAT family acetyltransferase [Penicillium macrosclerotiorum]